LSSRAVYGKVRAGEEDDTLLIGPSPPPNVTPLPTSAFFDSQFWRRFQLQRPVIEPHEFVARFIASQNGKSDSLGITGRLLAMALVVWASSFGIDENGQPLDPLEDHIYQYQEHKVDIHDQFDTDASAKLRTERRTRTNEMVKEMLYLIDVHGILRKPSWDGVRILLMILPLAQGKRFHLPPPLPLCSSLLNTMATFPRRYLFDRCPIKLGTIGTYSFRSISDLPTPPFFLSPLCLGRVR
jgi:hypothetical protein